jgi:excisionase family DNA binding protein
MTVSIPVLTVAEFAELFKVSLPTAYKAAHSGRFAVIRIGDKKIFFLKRPLLQMLEGGDVAADVQREEAALAAHEASKKAALAKRLAEIDEQIAADTRRAAERVAK